MGVGKSTVSRILLKHQPGCVWLDGDWCWQADPFVVNDVTKAMVIDNVCHCLNNFISCGQYKNIIFSWVMHDKRIIDGILSRLDCRGVHVLNVSLICTPYALEQRLRGDIQNGLRTSDVLGRAVERLNCCVSLDTQKIDTTDLSPREVAGKIENLLK